MARVLKGVSALRLPASALSILDSARQKNTAGMALPSHPDQATYSRIDGEIRRKTPGINGINTIPADKIRMAATCNGANSVLPSGANIPNFIKTKELPHTMHNKPNKIHFRW